MTKEPQSQDERQKAPETPIVRLVDELKEEGKCFLHSFVRIARCRP